MEQTVKQLFIRYINHSADADDIAKVLELIQSGGYEAEWEAAMLETEPDEKADISARPDLKATVEGFDEDGLYRQLRTRTVAAKKRNQMAWMQYAASLIFISAVAACIYFLRIEAGPAPAARQTAAVQNGHRWIRLPDGTSVQLNKNSRIVYPESFAGMATREVTLSGEAFFDVRHDRAHPFIIHTGKIKTTVLGTAFNISAYQAKKAVTVTVLRGKVRVQQEHFTLATLRPDEQLSWNAVKHAAAKRHVNADQVISWKSVDMIMDDITLEQAAEMIAGRYRVQVSFANRQVGKCRFTAAFLSKNDLGQVTAVLSEITGASFRLQGNRLLIDGPGC